MSLTNKDKAAVKALWAKISKSADLIGANALGRMLVVYPQTKTYFSHWPDLSPGSASVKAHGKKVMGGIGMAVASIDDMVTGMLELSEKHAFTLRVDPANFKIISHCILVETATLFPTEFTPEAHVSYDKFLNCLALALSERYR
ncbi:hemoglobin subunit alpha-1-like [Plectropomus leopardus]|uniref:hemoglobin, alpha embryonic 5 n=1 Tax=Plectropomus leopardus TaxID=160734 RepID=UPI001C4CC888|nr:hemoglobin, alpha embryonic 5 [Plectropomus leopardus]XP_042372215.1 hemoglobin subunit alpha-1-like [Plectropomus leopardus]